MHPRFNSRGLWFVVFLNFVFLLAFFLFFEYKFSRLDNKISAQNVLQQLKDKENNLNQKISEAPGCNTECQEYITRAIREQSELSQATPSSTPKATVKPSTNSQVTYIPLSGGTTQETTWTDIPGTNFNFNVSDYGSKSYITWDANLRVINKNDTTYVRIFDKTHGIAVNGSEISISDTYTSTDVVSEQLSFWAGNNNYVIQIKSLTGSTAYMDSGRIKVSY